MGKCCSKYKKKGKLCKDCPRAEGLDKKGRKKLARELLAKESTVKESTDRESTVK